VRYLLRYLEAGREGQPHRQKIRRDISAAVKRIAPEAQLDASLGRLVVESSRPLDRELSRIHGVSSLSPVVYCSLDELDEHVVELARSALVDAGSFCVRVKRVGKHAFSSSSKAAALGHVICTALPDARVSLKVEDVTIGVEIRHQDCYIYDTVVPGIDRRGGPPHLTDEPRFLVDQMLGRLVVWLRVLGFDAIYARQQPDSELVRRARRERRVILTRDRELADNPSVQAIFVDSLNPDAQLAQVAAALSLKADDSQMFTRCTVCNAEVELASVDSVRGHVPAPVFEQYTEFHCCPACDRYYWRGEHCASLTERLRAALGGQPELSRLAGAS
jgi:uncharacterized protein with PIN domain/tRNA(Ser,Leu) C12 N-acetylase TAN1